MAKKRFLVEIDEPAEYHITEVLGPFGSFPGGSLPGRDIKPLTASTLKDQLERAFRYRRYSFKALRGKVSVTELSADLEIKARPYSSWHMDP